MILQKDTGRSSGAGNNRGSTGLQLVTMMKDLLLKDPGFTEYNTIIIIMTSSAINKMLVKITGNRNHIIVLDTLIPES